MEIYHYGLYVVGFLQEVTSLGMVSRMFMFESLPINEKLRSLALSRVLGHIKPFLLFFFYVVCYDYILFYGTEVH